ncbi:MAG: iron-sulfur cluster assembly accessory protein [bacterium]|nr:iron-sulfur cluster assembly accessory protein [bacterium]
MTLTNAAASRVQSMIDAREKPTAGIRIFVKTRGCSGLSYAMEYADQKGDFDEEVTEKGVTLFIDPKAVMFVLGTQMDYEEGSLESGFSFKNPNEKGRCGCGESFHV